MTLSPFQFLLLVLIGGSFIFAIIDRICKCIERKATAISFVPFSQNMSNVSVQNSTKNKSN